MTISARFLPQGKRGAQIMKGFVFPWLCIGFWILHGGLLSPVFAHSVPPLASLAKNVKQLSFCGEPVPLADQEVRERLEKELMLTAWDRPQVLLWLKRSRRYLPHVEKILRDNALPDDLKFVAIVESALRPHAGSSKGAVGFWQFVAHTGRKYGLTINERIDERRNVFAATRASAKYFRALHDALGSWPLAVAAYNMGENGLQAEILEQKTRDFYRLYLPLETQRFIFRILSVKLISKSPQEYGFELEESDHYPALLFDRVEVDCLEETPLRIVADAAGTDFKLIKDLNPELRGHYLAAGKHSVLVPKGSAAGFHARLQGLLKDYLDDRQGRVYIVKRGDNLSAIAKSFNVPLAALLIWNRLDVKRAIQPGDRLIIYGKQ
jgi:hypothetical protein